MTNKIKTTALWIWQLPQNLLGYFLSRNYYCYLYDTYWKQDWNLSGISLGNYIIADKNILNYDYMTVLQHERGHQKQSLYLGPLYLFIVGIPSITRNIWDGLFHKHWSVIKRTEWYYSSYPENWADKLGRVNRNLSL